MSKDPESYHIFMFPFRWDISEENKNLDELSFGERVNLNKFDEMLDKNKWKEKYWDNYFEENEVLAYNEYAYFYENVRDIIYGKKDNKNNKQINLYYEYKHDDNSKYIIQTLKNKYELIIEKISLKIYRTGIGILSYHLENYSASKKEDVLKINDYGRRIYSQFLPLEKTKKSFLANELKIEINGQIFAEESFNDCKNIKENKNISVKISETIMKLLGDNFTCDKTCDKEKIFITPVIDDRMYVVSWYGNEKVEQKNHKYRYNKRINKNSLQDINNLNCKNEYGYLENDFWSKYIFVDNGNSTCKSRVMLKKLLKKHTYDRWVDNGRLYGISRYSFVVLTDRSWFAKEVILNHVKTMYYQMACLALMQRASILRFSDEVSKITKDIDGGNNNFEIRELNEEYLKFINRMYFREVTAQEQGIELYDKILECMRIPKEAKALEAEINELHQYATLKEESRRNELLAIIAIIGAVFAVPNFVTGFLGMDIFNFSSFSNNQLSSIEWWFNSNIWTWFAVYFSVPVILGCVLFKLSSLFTKKVKKIGYILFIIAVLIIIITVVLN